MASSSSSASVPTPAFLSRIHTHLSRLPSPTPTTSPAPLPGGASKTPPTSLYLPPPAVPRPEDDLVPPENFAVVDKGVYRSGFPKKRNFRFLETLGLKTVLTLVLEDYPEANLKWCQSQDIQFMQFGIPGNKEPFDNIPEDVIAAALVAILDRRNHPVLIHCNKGKHRTGCLIGCIRRLQAFSLTSTFDEYRRFSAPKSRAVDQQFIDLFDLAPVWRQVAREGGGRAWLPEWRMLVVPRELGEREREKERDRDRERERERERERMSCVQTREGPRAVGKVAVASGEAAQGAGSSADGRGGVERISAAGEVGPDDADDGLVDRIVARIERL
ncbi:tyrosine-protein phosphatase siw14 [Cryptotrichosporon argae]